MTFGFLAAWCLERAPALARISLQVLHSLRPGCPGSPMPCRQAIRRVADILRHLGADMARAVPGDCPDREPGRRCRWDCETTVTTARRACVAQSRQLADSRSRAQSRNCNAAGRDRANSGCRPRSWLRESSSWSVRWASRAAGEPPRCIGPAARARTSRPPARAP